MASHRQNAEVVEASNCVFVIQLNILSVTPDINFGSGAKIYGYWTAGSGKMLFQNQQKIIWRLCQYNHVMNDDNSYDDGYHHQKII